MTVAHVEIRWALITRAHVDPVPFLLGRTCWSWCPDERDDRWPMLEPLVATFRTRALARTAEHSTIYDGRAIRVRVTVEVIE